MKSKAPPGASGAATGRDRGVQRVAERHDHRSSPPGGQSVLRQLVESGPVSALALELLRLEDGDLALDARRWISPAGRTAFPTRRGFRVRVTPALLAALSTVLIAATDLADANE